MKLSVCFITYNHEKFVRQALDGILAQRVDFPWEVLVGEDCSTDRTGEIVREYAARRPDLFRVLDTSTNLGPHQNFQRTLAECTGVYVAMIDGDDYWSDPQKLDRQVAFLDANPGYSICFHPVDIVDAEGRPSDTYPHTTRTDFGLGDLLMRNVIPTCSAVFRRGLFGPFPNWFFDCAVGDWPLHLLNLRHGRARMLPERMGAYRVHTGGVWSHRADADRFLYAVEMLSRLRGSLGTENVARIERSLGVHRFYRCWALRRQGSTELFSTELKQLREQWGQLPLAHRVGLLALRMTTHFPVLFQSIDRVLQWALVTVLKSRPRTQATPPQQDATCGN